MIESYLELASRIVCSVFHDFRRALAYKESGIDKLVNGVLIDTVIANTYDFVETPLFKAVLNAYKVNISGPALLDKIRKEEYGQN